MLGVRVPCAVPIWEIASRPDLTSQKENNLVGKGGNWRRIVQAIVAVIVGKRKKEWFSKQSNIIIIVQVTTKTIKRQYQLFYCDFDDNIVQIFLVGKSNSIVYYTVL